VFDGADVSIPCTDFRLAEMIFAQDPERRDDDSDADSEFDGSGRLHAGIVQIRGCGSPAFRRTVAQRMRTAPPCRALGRRRSVPVSRGRIERGGAQRALTGPAAHGRIGLSPERHIVNRIVYIVGLVVIVIAILSFFGLR
jgi:hypothetical protein